MKKLFLIGFIVVSYLSATSQTKDTIGLNLPLKDNNIIYEGIVDVPGLSKDELYKNAKQWFVDYFKSSKDVIQNEERQDGEIIGKGIVFIYLKMFMQTDMLDDKMTIRIDCKDSKYRYRIYDSDIIWVANNQDNRAENILNKLLGTYKISNLPKSYCRKILENMNSETNETIKSLKKAMNLKPDNF